MIVVKIEKKIQKLPSAKIIISTRPFGKFEDYGDKKVYLASFNKTGLIGTLQGRGMTQILAISDLISKIPYFGRDAYMNF